MYNLQRGNSTIACTPPLTPDDLTKVLKIEGVKEEILIRSIPHNKALSVLKCDPEKIQCYDLYEQVKQALT